MNFFYCRVREFLAKLENIFVRLNKDIVAGIWQTALIMPLDCAMFIYFTGEPSYPNLDYRFWIFFLIYTIFFLSGYAWVPLARKRKIANLLNRLEKEGKITEMQHKRIWVIIKDNSRYAPLWTKAGIMLFLMENLYCLSIIFAFFGGEGLINACLNGTEKAMSIIHLCLACGCLVLEAKLDKILARKMRKKYKMQNVRVFYGANKEISTQLIADISGDSSSDNLMNLHFEHMLEDITNILDVSNDKKKKKKTISRKFGKSGLPKGRLEKAKQGIQSKKDKKTKKTQKQNLKHTKLKKKSKNRFKIKVKNKTQQK